MKIRTIVAATSAALFSLGAIAAGDDKQKQSQGSTPEKSAQTQSSGAASGSSSTPAATEKSSGASASAEKSSGAAASASTSQAQSSDLVKQAQQKLSQGGHKVQADGVMGPKTQAALKEFQQAKGIEASGELNKDTLAALGVSGEVTTGSAAIGGSASGEAKSSGSAGAGASSGQSQPAASSGQSQQPAAKPEGQSSEKSK
jgi:peptidoglycan hydrolase-like protein with peptidoglycan-binding domain